MHSNNMGFFVHKLCIQNLEIGQPPLGKDVVHEGMIVLSCDTIVVLGILFRNILLPHPLSVELF